MILLGCMLAWTAAVAPRVILVLAWIFSDRWAVVWGSEWLTPLLGIVFLPYTTIMYLLAWQPAIAGGSSIEGWDWMWIALGVFLDIMKWAQMAASRKEAAARVSGYYPSGAPRSGAPRHGGLDDTTAAAIAGGQVPPSTSPTAADADTAPTAASVPPEAPKDE